MMKIKVTSDQSAPAVVLQCPYCAGMGVQVASKGTSKSCSSCKSTRKAKSSKQKTKPEEDIHPQKISVVAVGNSSSEKNKKTPSLFGRLFSKSEKDKRYVQDFIRSNTEISTTDSTPYSFQPSVTLLEVRNSPKLTSSNPNLHQSFKIDKPNVEYSNDNLCNKCNCNPAQLTVADSKGMKAERLCRSCHLQLKDAKKSSEQIGIDNLSADSLIKRSNSASALNNDIKKTVILINDGKNPHQVNSAVNSEKMNVDENSTEEKLLKILEDLKTSVLQSKNIKQDSNVATISQTTTTKVTTKPPKDLHTPIRNEIETRKFNDKDGHPVTVLSLSSTKVQRSNTFVGDQKNANQSERRFQQSSSGFTQRSEDDFAFEEEPSISFQDDDFERPFPYNPDYRSTLGKYSTLSSLKMPSELEAVGPYQGKNSKAEEILQSNRSDNIGTLTSPQDSFKNSKQEKISVKDSNNSNLKKVYLMRSFGKYSEKIQPGTFNEPSTLKLGANDHKTFSTDTIVVTDSKSSTVQVLDMKGECLTLIRIAGVKSSCQISSNHLVAATDGWLALYDFKGNERARINLDVSKGMVNSVVPMRTRAMFVMVAQANMISIFDCSSSLILAKKVEYVNEKVSFKNIMDVSVTSNENLVILDAGAIGGTGAIYVVDISGGKLKSAIYPKHESCGSFRNPTAISVDRQNRILVSDSGNSRILLFSHKTGSQQIQVMTLTDLKLSGSSGSDVVPAGMDVNDDDFIFLVVKGWKIAEIRIYSSH